MFNMYSIAAAACALFAEFDFVSAGRPQQALRRKSNLDLYRVATLSKAQVMDEISDWRDSVCGGLCTDKDFNDLMEECNALPKYAGFSCLVKFDAMCDRIRKRHDTLPSIPA